MLLVHEIKTIIAFLVLGVLILVTVLMQHLKKAKNKDEGQLDQKIQVLSPHLWAKVNGNHQRKWPKSLMLKFLRQ
jgi:Tfp pilus assembly protein PilV